MVKIRGQSRRIALSGILLALCLATLIIQSIFPLANYTIYILSSLYISIVIIEIGALAGVTFYFASVILALLIVPNKVFLLPFIVFFGLYGLIKYLTEKTGKLYIEMPLKYLFFNLVAFLSIYFFKDMLFQSINLPDFPYVILIIIAEIGFLAYDYFYTLFIGFYTRRIKK